MGGGRRRRMEKRCRCNRAARKQCGMNVVTENSKKHRALLGFTAALLLVAVCSLSVRAIFFTRYDNNSFTYSHGDNGIRISPIFSLDRWTMENIERGSAFAKFKYQILYGIAIPVILIESTKYGQFYGEQSVEFKAVKERLSSHKINNFDEIFFSDIHGGVFYVYKDGKIVETIQ